uniref:SAP domain-containing protein n=1 Tax=Parascaris univalens TaxID=6257 RepID=A0A914ZTI8_PARUN
MDDCRDDLEKLNDAKDMLELHNKLFKVTEELRAQRIANKSDDVSANDGKGHSPGEGKKAGDIPPPWVLPVVPYQEPLRKDSERVFYVMKHLHSMTAAEMRSELKLIHIDSRGKRSQLFGRLKKYYRKEFAILKNAEPMRNRTERYYEYFVVMDFECTCEDEVYEYEHEIIEFPAVLVDVWNRRIVDTFHSHVRPRINPKLSEFCSRLTGVTQEMVDNALPFVDVFDSFRMWMQSHRLGHTNARYAFVTDGPWDIAKFFQMQCLQSGLGSVPHDFRHYINIRKAFMNKYLKGHRPQKTNLSGMLSELGMKFEGREHCGLDDSKNIARIVIRMLEDRSELRINERIARGSDKRKVVPTDASKEDRERQAWRDSLPFKVHPVSRDAFISGEYLDCDTCDEADD